VDLGKLSPDQIQKGLIRAGLFLAGWEVLAGEIVDKVKSFYWAGFDETGDLFPDYKEQVLALDPKSTFNASLHWLVESRALTAEQVARVQELRKHRNQVAHELPEILLDPGHEVSADLFREMLELIRILGVFWGRIEMDINPDFVDRDVKDEGIVSGTMMLMTLLVAAAEAKPEV